MNDQPMDAAQETAGSQKDAVEADIHRLLRVRSQELPGIERVVEAIGSHLYSPEAFALATAAAIFSKAFLETLGTRAGDSAANLPKRVRDLARRFHRRKDGGEEFHIGAGGMSATVIVTEDLPDQARLALLDLDVTAEELRGKLLRWDSAASAWRPAESFQDEVGNAVSGNPS
jgi:hypothetical protein